MVHVANLSKFAWNMNQLHDVHCWPATQCYQVLDEDLANAEGNTNNNNVTQYIKNIFLETCHNK